MGDDSKYVVIKREDWEAMFVQSDQQYSLGARSVLNGLAEKVLDDAVVIRLQDQFAPPALDAYANSMLTVVEQLRLIIPTLPVGPERDRLESISKSLDDTSHYFHEKAAEAWSRDDRKLPD